VGKPFIPRDYSLVGPEAAHAVDAGLSGADWYQCPIPRKRLKELMKRSDQPAIRDTIIWLGLMAVSGGLGVWLWGTWWCVPFFAVYGVLYGSASDSRWHEAGHGTAFRTRWMNDVVYHIACFMIMREPTIWRWSHTRHHTDTLIVGRDPEISAMRPPRLAKIISNFAGLTDVPIAFYRITTHALGRLTPDEDTYVPEMERRKVYLVARIWLAIYAATVLACFAMGSILPAMLIGLPRLYGAWHHLLCGLTQHAGLAEDTLDHRLNSRTVYMNPISRFIYWNMNYHVEHHMFPMVPYHALPQLHEEIKGDCPRPYSGFWETYKEIVPTIVRQLSDPTYFVRRRLPGTAGRPETEPAAGGTLATA
jgi:fatty acid desaturase